VETNRGKDLREEISQAGVAKGGIIREMKARAMTLEEIFTHITTTEKGGETVAESIDTLSP